MPSSVKDRHPDATRTFDVNAQDDHEDQDLEHLKSAANQNSPRTHFRSQFLIFLPAVITALICASSVGWMYWLGAGSNSATKLISLVGVIGVPLLAAHAFLRFQTVFIDVQATGVLAHSGWPISEPVHLSYRFIKSVRVRRGLAGRLFGGGTVVLNLDSGDKTAVADLRNPQRAARLIRACIEADRVASQTSTAFPKLPDETSIEPDDLESAVDYDHEDYREPPVKRIA